eukprot:9920988-Karenia_brevis.AAC.1
MAVGLCRVSMLMSSLEMAVGAPGDGSRRPCGSRGKYEADWSSMSGLWTLCIVVHPLEPYRARGTAYRRNKSMSGAGTPDPPSSPVVSIIGVVPEDVQREEEVTPVESMDISVD